MTRDKLHIFCLHELNKISLSGVKLHEIQRQINRLCNVRPHKSTICGWLKKAAEAVQEDNNNAPQAPPRSPELVDLVSPNNSPAISAPIIRLGYINLQDLYLLILNLF